MEIRTVIGLGKKLVGTVTRETCEKCGQFSRIFVNDKYSSVSYMCGNPKCGGDK